MKYKSATLLLGNHLVLACAAAFVAVATATAADDKSCFFLLNRSVFVSVLKWHKSHIPLTLIRIKSQLKMLEKLITQNAFIH